ncbi:MAG: pyruvate kinase [Patescibacteria group bacterium]
MSSRVQIIATLGPTSATPEILQALLAAGVDVVRFNLSWTAPTELRAQVGLVRTVAAKAGRAVPVIADLPGPRVQESAGHKFNAQESVPTAHDVQLIALCTELKIEYVGVSFVGKAAELRRVREALGGAPTRIVAKIERAEALENLAEIIAAADGVMVARGDLGHAIPLEQVPFVQERIVREASAAGKPVIVATDMLRSMIQSQEPTRAEVGDVATAVLQGADAIMLSDETAVGIHPTEVVVTMERIALEAEKHLPQSPLHPL